MAGKIKFFDFVNSIEFPETVKKKERAEYVKLVFKAIRDRLSEGNAVGINNFGTFDIVENGEREGRNPRTGEVIRIEAKKTVKFKASKELVDSLN